MLLDAAGTLLDIEASGARLSAELRRRAAVDVSAQAGDAAFRAEIAFYLDHHMEGRDPSSLERLRDRCARVVADALGLDGVDLVTVRAAMLAALRFRAHPDAAPALRELRRRGLRLVAASNWDCSLADALAAAGLAGLLDGVEASAAAGAAKPDPRLFRAALAAAGVEPQAAIHVGDSVEHDVRGARAAGIRAVLLARDGAAPPGVPAIRSLGQLPDVI